MLDNVKVVKIEASEVVANGLNLLYYTIGIIAVVAIIIAGLSYITAAGDPAKAAKAKSAILYAVIGLVVVALAFSITRFIIGRF